MPMYDCECPNCGRIEKDMIVKDIKQIILCPECEQQMNRLIGACTFKFTNPSVIKHKRKYGNNHHAVPKTKNKANIYGIPRNNKK